MTVPYKVILNLTIYRIIGTDYLLLIINTFCNKP